MKPVKRKYDTFELSGVEVVNDLYSILSFNDDEIAGNILPGNFLEIKQHCSRNNLFKPISIYDVNGSTISIMIKALGDATRALCNLNPGDSIDIIAPLGTDFPTTRESKVLLVSGGVGYPPLKLLKKHLMNSNDIYWIHGGATELDIFECDDAWTVDGSFGKKGLVTNGVNEYLKYHKVNVIYACGPSAMLKELAFIALNYNICLYVSLEEYMACGVGVCYGCAVPVGNMDNWDYKRVCKEGPVFKSSDIVWELM